MLRIKLTSVIVDDQEKAHRFYTQILGFQTKRDIPMGGARWLTLVSQADPDGAELLLEPMGFEPARVYQKALLDAGIPLTAFAVDDVQAEYERLKKRGVVFRGEPSAQFGPPAVSLEDTCGNLIQIFQPPAE